MKAKILILFLFTANIINAQTIIEYGVIEKDSTWSLAKSPYIINGSILIAKDASLNIEKGVVVRLNKDCYIKVEGDLVANGTNAEPIQFIPNSNLRGNNWQGIWLNTTTTHLDANNKYVSGSIIKNCIIDSCVFGIKIQDCRNILIDDCEISNSLGYGIYLTDSDSTTIKNCFIYNTINGIFIQANSAVNYSTIENNYITDIEENGISFQTNNAQQKNNVIRNNTISGCLWAGIAGGSGSISTYGFENNTISENVIAYNNTGLEILHNSNDISLNKIYGNDLGIWLRASGNNVSGNLIFNNNFAIQADGVTGCIIAHNSIFQNNEGLRFQTSLTVSTTSTIVKHNSFYDNKTRTFEINGMAFTNPIDSNNIIPDGSLYAMDLSSSTSSYDFRHNFWGTSDSIKICESIYDYYDNFNLGKVLFSPFEKTNLIEAPVIKPKNVIKSENGTNLRITWDPNQETDISGYKIYFGKLREYYYSDMIDVGNINDYILSDIAIDEEIAVTAYDKNQQAPNSMLLGHESWYSVAATTTTSIEDLEQDKKSFYVYPNPTSDKLIVKSENQNVFIRNIFIVDISGRTVFTQKYSKNFTFFEESIITNNLHNGLYLIKIDYDKASEVHRFIKQ